ncbi:Hypothetical predicted protein [Olea europaea subsp. europaea]|uniref:Uncharacterized protein n=1 Tax=Olea europaea subsp. europaea TaxID=158383 RepID=A0A8S0UA63_OLEEU|nr:Hypothetical predicted protein [Olea europaea subsp. europaea]
MLTRQSLTLSSTSSPTRTSISVEGAFEALGELLFDSRLRFFHLLIYVFYVLNLNLFMIVNGQMDEPLVEDVREDEKHEDDAKDSDDEDDDKEDGITGWFEDAVLACKCGDIVVH